MRGSPLNNNQCLSFSLSYVTWRIPENNQKIPLRHCSSLQAETPLLGGVCMQSQGGRMNHSGDTVGGKLYSENYGYNLVHVTF